MKKNVFVLMLLAAFVFTSCSNDYSYNTKSEELSPFYEEALRSKEFAAYYKTYNQYKEAMADFVGQLSKEQISTFRLLWEQSNGNSSNNKPLLKYYWKEISVGHCDKLEELLIDVINASDSFYNKYSNLSEKDKLRLSEALLNSSLQMAETMRFSKTRAVENNKDKEDEESKEDNEENSDGDLEEEEEVENESEEDSGTSYAECVDKCKKEYDAAKIKAGVILLCEAAIDVFQCLRGKGYEIDGLLSITLLYEAEMAFLQAEYNDCLKNC